MSITPDAADVELVNVARILQVADAALAGARDQDSERVALKFVATAERLVLSTARRVRPDAL